MPFNQKQIIEEAELTYSSLGKAFKEQTKAIKDQGEEQVKAIEGTSTNAHYENVLLLSKEREIFKNIYNIRLDRIEELTKKLIMMMLQNLLLKRVVMKIILLN